LVKFSPSILDDIRSRLTISSVVGRRVQWDRRKSNPGKGDFWACCPFHTEKSPSFHVEDRKGRYHCFGCKVSGDVFTFLVEKEGLSFPEAVERLADEAGISLPKFTPEEIEREKVRSSLYDVMELASKYFQEKLFISEGGKARDYLKSRGLKEETILEFELGFAPNSKSGLKDYLLKCEITEQQMIEAGLLLSGEDFPVSIDRFRDRIMFPILDAKGRTIAFGGRAMSKDAPAKYLNSPETPLFSKGKILYNFSNARQTAFEKGSIVVVEGYMDAIAVNQGGFKNVVATLGTAMTEDHLSMIWKLVPEPVLCFDGDNAGFKAASNAFDRALPYFKSGYSLGFAFLSGGKDPADMMFEGRSQEFSALIANPTPASEYFWNRSTQSRPINTPEQKAGLELSMLHSIEMIKDETVRRQYKYQTRIRLSDLFYKFDKTKLRTNFSRRGLKSVIPSLEDENEANVTKIILGIAVEFPQYFYQETDRFSQLNFSSEDYRVFQRALYTLLVEEANRTVSALYAALDDRYYKVLEQVHGHEVIAKNSNSKILKRRGHALFARFPVTKYGPSESFVLRALDYFHLVLQRIEVRKDFEDASKDLISDLNEKTESRLNALLHELEFLGAKIIAEEKILTEDAAVYTDFHRNIPRTKPTAQPEDLRYQ
jgi:DNA primase